jgi:hypothetical protein
LADELRMGVAQTKRRRWPWQFVSVRLIAGPGCEIIGGSQPHCSLSIEACNFAARHVVVMWPWLNQIPAVQCTRFESVAVGACV